MCKAYTIVSNMGERIQQPPPSLNYTVTNKDAIGGNWPSHAFQCRQQEELETAQHDEQDQTLKGSNWPKNCGHNNFSE